MAVLKRQSIALWLCLFCTGDVNFVMGDDMESTESSAAAAALVYTFTPQSCHHFQSIMPDNHTNDEGQSNTTTAATMTSLIRNPNTTTCHRALGVENSRRSNSTATDGDYHYITSKTTSRDLLRSIQNANQGISFSLWLKPDVSSFNNNASLQRPILTIGRRSHSTPTLMGGLNECDDNELDFQLSQRGNHSLEILYRTSETAFEPCQYYQVLLSLENYQHYNPINTATATEGEEQQRHLSSSSSSSSVLLAPGKLLHVTVSLYDNNQLVYINGHPTLPLTRPFRNDLSHWQYNREEEDDSYGLHLFAYNNNLLQHPEEQQEDNVWRGTIYQLRIDLGNQSTSTVQSILLARLPPSEPFAINFTTVIHEDAEAVAGSNAPEWYRNKGQVAEETANSSSTAILSRIPLLFESLDQQVHNLLLENGIIVGLNGTVNDTTTANGSSNGGTFLSYVTKLPEVGSLYLTDGTKLEASTNDDDMTKNRLFPVLYNHQVVYLPPLHAYSNTTTSMGSLLNDFASFDFCVTKKPIISAQQCISATARIIVEPVNDPPIAWTGNTRNFVVVPEGIETLSTPKIYLGGTDVDVDDYILQVQVTQSPLYGRLILSVGSFRQDGIRHGTDVAELENIIRDGRDPVHVKYIFDPPSFPSAVQGSNAKDSFRFRVADQHYRWSAEETVTLQISSAMKVVNPNVHVVSEDSQQQGNIILTAKDGSGYENRRLGFYFESTPKAVTQGVLMDSTTNVSLQVGSILSASMANVSVTIPITFIPAPNYCTTPSKQKNHSVQFQIRAVAFDGQGGGGSGSSDNDHIVSVSDPVTQLVHVECTRDDLSMIAPHNSDKTHRLLQSTLRRFPEDSCRGDIFDPTTTTTTEDISAKCPRAAIFQGITVASKDLHQQLVHVSVYAGAAGFLTFNKHFWNLTRPVHGRRAMSAGQTSFYAFPLDLTTIFSHLHFQSYRVGDDQVDIMLLYGNCTHHLQIESSPTAIGRADDAVSKLAMSSSTCQVLRHSIPVFVEKDEEADHYNTSLVPSLPWQLFVCLLLYPTIYYAFVQIDRMWSRAMDEDDGDTTMVGSPDEFEDDDDANSSNGNNHSNELNHDIAWPDWIQHKTADGEFYYENTNDGSVTWMAPVGEKFVPFQEDGQKDDQNEEESKDEII